MVDALDVGQRSRPARVVINGVKYTLHRDPRSKNYRIRKRTRAIQIDESLGVCDLQAAKDKAQDLISSRDVQRTRKRRGGATLKEITAAYLAMPKRCSDDTADANVKRLAKVVAEAWGRELHEVCASDLGPDLWEDYARVRQGGKLDLSTRRAENRGINSALRMASSVFHEGLAVGYKKAGIILNLPEISQVQWLPEIKSKVLPLASEPIEEMHKALKSLKKTNRPMWRAIMIAEHAGLRSSEISAARKSWLEKSPYTGDWRFAVHDRPEEGYWHKTGADYTAPILSRELEKDLLACPADGPLVPVKGSRDFFFRHLCNDWIRQFIQKPHKGMHRLRALYLERIRDLRASEIRAQDAGVEAARQAAGHTSSKTTKRSYLPAT